MKTELTISLDNYSGTWKEKKQPLDNSEATNYYDNYIYNYDGAAWYGQLNMYNTTRLFFDATGWSETAIKMCIGHANYQKYYSMNSIDNTKLYYGTVGSDWNDAMGVGVVGKTSASDGENWLTNVSARASEYTGFKHQALDKNSTGNAYLMVNAGNAGQEPTMSYNDDFLTLLNSTQTVKFAVSTGAAAFAELASGTTPAKITISSYKFATGV